MELPRGADEDASEGRSASTMGPGHRRRLSRVRTKPGLLSVGIDRRDPPAGLLKLC
jgi:hypothetical protein